MKRNIKKKLDKHKNKITSRLKNGNRAEQSCSMVNHIFEPPIISIIVRTKNRPHLLSRCLQSLDNQLRRPDEVVVVNDAGISIEHVASGFSKLNVHLINFEEPQGRARAGNLGVEGSIGNVIGFLDDDDQFLPDHLQRLEQAMLQFDAKVAYSGCRVIKRDLMGESASVRETEVLQYNDSFDALRLRYENYIPLISILLEKSLWIDIGGFDESFDMFEDWDMLIRLSASRMFYHLNWITSEYGSWGGGQITHTANRESFGNAYKKIFQKHLMALSNEEQLDFLKEYWLVSQERRGQLTLCNGDIQKKITEITEITENFQKQIESIHQGYGQQIGEQKGWLEAECQKKISEITENFQQQIEALQTELEYDRSIRGIGRLVYKRFVAGN